MAKTILEYIQEDILLLLSDSPMTIPQLVEKLNKPYATVQQAHLALRNDNKIIKFDNKARNARYTLGTNNGPKSIVPYIRLTGQDYKLTAFTGRKNFTEGAANAADVIIKAWATIAMTGQRLSRGIPDEVLIKRLKRQQVELLKARKGFEDLAFFITQMLDNPRLWDVAVISQFPDDKDWAAFKPFLQEMYDHYYSETDSSNGTETE